MPGDEPRLVLVSGYPPGTSFGGGITLRRLLERYPSDHLTVVTSRREYLRRRPADPEGWLLAAWTTAMSGRADDGAALARYAITLDPQRADLVAAAKVLKGPAR